MSEKAKHRQLTNKYKQLFSIFTSPRAHINRHVLQFILNGSQAELLQSEAELEKRQIFLEMPGSQVVDLKALIDETNHFNRLPDEVVECIFKNLKDSKDLASCSRTCGRFNKILEPTKSQWLFYEVLPIIVRAGHLDDRDVYKMNKVCSEWKKGVENLCKKRMGGLLELDRVDSSSYKESKQVEELMKKLKWTFLCPEISCFHGLEKEITNGSLSSELKEKSTAGLKLWHDTEEMYASSYYDFWRYSEVLLLQLGKELWFCKLILNYLHFDFFRILFDLCQHLPNVRDLCLVGKINYWGLETEPDEIRDEEESTNAVTQLRQLIGLTLYQIPTQFYTVIFPQLASQLKKLELGDDIHKLRVFKEIRLPNLEILRLTGYLMSLDVLTKCPSLKSLEFMYDLNQSFHRLFQVLKPFSSNLWELKLHIFSNRSAVHFVHVESPFVQIYLDYYFSQLQVLKLEAWPESFDILLYMPALQFLQISVGRHNYNEDLANCYTNVQETEIVEVHGFIDRMYESNIWILNSGLGEIKVDCYFYGNNYINKYIREEYENRR